MTSDDTTPGEIEEPDTLPYRIHPVAALFPYITGEAFREFVEDIRINGQREPVVLDAQGRLADGRNRARACQVLGIDVKETIYAGDDVEAWIISHNIHRRHLTESQRAMIAARLADLKNGGDRKSAEIRGSIEPLIGLTREEAGARLNVSRASVGRAKRVLESGDADLIQAVEAGDMRVNGADKILREKNSPTAPSAPVSPPPIPSPRRRGGRKHHESLENLLASLGGIEMWVKDTDELDGSISPEDAQQFLNELDTSIRSLNALKRKLKERAKCNLRVV